MDKATQMAKTSARGSVNLLIGVAASTVILAVGTIILANALTQDQYGLYGVVLIPATLIGLFNDWGINSAMTKYIAKLKAQNADFEIRDVIVAGFVFEIIVGLILVCISLISANFIAATIFHRPGSAFLISIIAVSILGGSIFNAAQSVFVGFENMRLRSITTIIQAIAKTAMTLSLVFLGFGVIGATLGYTSSFILAGLVGIAGLYFFILRKTLKEDKTRIGITHMSRHTLATLKKMLRYGIPLFVSSVLGGILVQFYSFLVASYVINNTAFGSYSVAGYFATLLTFVSIPVATVLFPAFAKLDPEKEQELVKNVFAASVKYTALLLVPATMVLMVLSTPIIGTLFPGRYNDAPFYLILYIPANLLVIFGNLTLPSFLSGLGETKVLAKVGVVSTAFGIPLGILLISTYGIPGVLVASAVSAIPGMCYGLYWVLKHYQAKADFKSSVKIFFASAIAAAATYAPANLIHTTALIRLLLGATIFLAIYLLAAPMIGAISQADINNIRNMFSGLGVISKIVNIPLNVTEKARQLRDSK